MNDAIFRNGISSPLNKVFAAVLLLCSGLALSAESFQTVIQTYTANQQNVKSFIGTGSLNVQIGATTASGKTTNVDSQIAIYMKYPNMFKLVTSGAANSISIQKGDLLSQKLPGATGFVTSKVSATSDLYKKYFGYEESPWLKDVQIIEQATVDDAQGKLTEFALKPPSATATTAAQAGKSDQVIDRVELYFNTDDMLVRSISKAQEKTLVTTNLTYEKIGTIWVAKTISTTMAVGEAQIASTIQYNSLSLNVSVSDHEFDVK